MGSPVLPGVQSSSTDLAASPTSSPDVGGAVQGFTSTDDGISSTPTATAAATSPHSRVGGGGGGGGGVSGGGLASSTPTSQETVPAAVPTPTAVVFKPDVFAGRGGHVFNASDSTKVFVWEIKNGTIAVKNITWFVLDFSPDKAIAQTTPTPIANATVGNSSDPFNSFTSGSVSLSLQSDKLSNFMGRDMTLQLGWETNDVTGLSGSSLFTVITDPSQISTTSFEDAVEAYQPEEITKPKSKDSTSSGPSISNPGDTGSGNPDSGNSGSVGSSSHSGLSSGAIAGIAVGCAVVGIAAIGLLVWFLIRRRRRGGHRRDTIGSTQQRLTSDYQPAPSGAFMADKEEPHTRVVAESATTARYSDAGTGIGTGTRGGINVDVDSNDRDSALADGAETPRGSAPHNIAHLVEDGMTEAEIRRLEEEERQLDAEIERAARGS